ncbi:DNA-J related domain-containing protein [Pseudoalteromonas sp. T1lg65]|uniref:DNA-J related domain-containing protein n=1 Tax=Pseudoalteromonas sp. T1lg65 TaxID=2077101 RepID=UPI003F796D21
MFNPIQEAIFQQLCYHDTLKVHTLAADLLAADLLPKLDADENKNLFKRNFLIMNALYQLQNELYQVGQLLQVSALNIKLDTKPLHSLPIMKPDPLKEYYLNWDNYETSAEEVQYLLESFWLNFTRSAHGASPSITKSEQRTLIAKWQLSEPFDRATLSKKWHKMALAHHPDRQGCETEFKKLQMEYNILRTLAL